MKQNSKKYVSILKKYVDILFFETSKKYIKKNMNNIFFLIQKFISNIYNLKIFLNKQNIFIK